MLKKLKIIGTINFLIGFLFFGLNAVAESYTVQKSETATDGEVVVETPTEILDRAISEFDQDYRNDRDDRDSEATLLDLSLRRYAKRCEGDKACEEICRDIYNRSSIREYCLEFPVAQVEILLDIYEIFENPFEDELDSISLLDFKVFVGIDSRPLEKLIGKFSRLEARRVLIWIANDQNIAEVFQNKDHHEEYNLLEELLEAVDSDKKKALSKSIDSGDSFMEIVVDSGNEEALDWIHGFFDKECHTESFCIFKNWYCEVVDNDDTWDNLLVYDEKFGNVVDEILEYPISSPPSWWKENIRAYNLDINQLKSLCNAELKKSAELIIKETAIEESGAGEETEAGAAEPTTSSEAGN